MVSDGRHRPIQATIMLWDLEPQQPTPASFLSHPSPEQSTLRSGLPQGVPRHEGGVGWYGFILSRGPDCRPGLDIVIKVEFEQKWFFAVFLYLVTRNPYLASRIPNPASRIANPASRTPHLVTRSASHHAHRFHLSVFLSV